MCKTLDLILNIAIKARRMKNISKFCEGKKE
jgi:hypothetical protein